MDVHLRAARADDAEAALPLFYSSGPEAFVFLFDTPRRDGRAFLRHAFARDAGFLGHGVFVAAEVDGRLAGIGAVYGGEELERLTLRALPTLIRFYGLGAFGTLWRLGLLSQIVVPPRRDVLFVSGLGVAPELRSRGIGARLVGRAVERARTEQRTAVALDVATTNPRAQQLYERLGFTVVAEHAPTGRIAALPGLRRMELPLPR